MRSSPQKLLMILYIFGIFAAFEGSYTGVTSIKDFLKFPAEPKHIVLYEASSLINQPTKAWVVIDDIQWDCNHIFYEEQQNRNDITVHTHILFTNRKGNVWGSTVFLHRRSCDSILQTEKEAMGVLDVVSNKEYTYLTANGLDISPYEKSSKFLSFCTDCGKTQSLNEAIWGIFFALIGLLIVVSPIILLIIAKYA